MLEAAIQLLESGDFKALTTNAVAAKAGVSIGTLYQYFPDKRALLDALVARELGEMTQAVLGSLQGGAPASPGDRVRSVVRAVIASYGGRGRAHRQLIAHALTVAPGARLSPFYAQLQEMLTARGVAAPGEAAARPLTPAQAFVLTHAMAGVLRSFVASDDPPPAHAVEDALVQLALGYVRQLRAAPC